MSGYKIPIFLLLTLLVSYMSRFAYIFTLHGSDSDHVLENLLNNVSNISCQKLTLVPKLLMLSLNFIKYPDTRCLWNEHTRSYNIA